ncbi:hypothetical protein NC652_038909 [Populus alba x Populus x berolinensis]|nr:hypothetical protein NC652_038909 [Populus alba x Populus x berolinensis]
MSLLIWKRIPIEEVFEQLKCSRGRSYFRRRSQQASSFWTKQTRREKGEQDSQVSGIYVESVVMGHGSCCVDGHSLGKMVMEDLQIGRTLSGSLSCWLLTPLLVFIEENNAVMETGTGLAKGAPEQILTLCNCKEDVKRKVHSVIDKFAEPGLRSLAVAKQEVPEKSKDAPGAPWQLAGLLPLFDLPGTTVLNH